MNAEIWYMILLPSSGLLFMLGGYRWKWMRRILLPCLMLNFAILNGAVLWRAIAMAGGLGVALSLPYGERVNYLGKFAVFCVYSLATVPLGLSVWQVVLPFLAIGMFALSNWAITEKIVVWKIWEFMMGTILAAIMLNILLS